MKNKSFTLIELLVVIVIIGILAGVIMVSTSSSIDKANLAKAQVFSNTVQEELLSNLISEWTFNEGLTVSGNAVNDDVKDLWGGNDGVVHGTPQILSGNKCIKGKCIKFDDNTDYISINNTTTFNDWSVCAWINRSGQEGNYDDVFTTQGSEYYPIIIRNSDNKIGLYSASLYSQTITSFNKWLYVCSTNGNNVVRIYINGNMENSANIEKTISGIIILGKHFSSNAEYFRGTLDELLLYNDSISSSQIKQNYIAGLNSMLSNGSISKKEYNERINTLAYDK